MTIDQPLISTTTLTHSHQSHAKLRESKNEYNFLPKKNTVSGPNLLRNFGLQIMGVLPPPISDFVTIIVKSPPSSSQRLPKCCSPSVLKQMIRVSGGGGRRVRRQDPIMPSPPPSTCLRTSTMIMIKLISSSLRSP